MIAFVSSVYPISFSRASESSFSLFGVLQVYGGKGEQKHRHIQFGGSAQQVYSIFFNC